MSLFVPEELGGDELLALRAALDEGLSAFGLSLDPPARDKLARYLQMLRLGNRYINLTAITDDTGMVSRHLLDSLALLELCPEEGSLIDVGTGAGLPGLPLAIARPALRVTLLDSLKKRIDFLETVCRELSLDHARPLWGRAEEQARTPALREAFDVATARAVADLRTLSEYCLPFVKVGGLFLPMKGGAVEEELRAAANAIGTLGGRLERVFTYRLPGEDSPMTVPVIRKLRATGERYPRRQAQIAKRPL